MGQNTVALLIEFCQRSTHLVEVSNGAVGGGHVGAWAGAMGKRWVLRAYRCQRTAWAKTRRTAGIAGALIGRMPRPALRYVHVLASLQAGCVENGCRPGLDNECGAASLTLEHVLAAVLDQVGGVLQVQLVLHNNGYSQI